MPGHVRDLHARDLPDGSPVGDRAGSLGRDGVLTARPPSDRRRFRAADALTLLVLTLLVWGIRPFARGVRMAGDDINFLYVAWHNLSKPFGEQILAKYPVDGWTRALAFWPFVLATHSPWPVAFLQLFYGGAWLLNGVAVARLAAVLAPGSRLAPFAAGALMVTATSDYLTGSVVYGPHLLGIAVFFLGAAELMRSAEPAGRSGRAVAAALLLAWSFFTVEYSYAAVPLLPLFVWLHGDRSWTPRCWRALAALAIAFVPPALILAQGLLQPGSRAGAVLFPDCSLPPHCAFREWLPLFLRHVVHNLWPPSWAFRPIPPWYDNFQAALPLAVFLGGALAGAGLVAWRFWIDARRDGAGATPAAPLLVAAAAFAATAAVNAASASMAGEYFVRSHFVSRGWASLGLAVVVAALARAPRWRIGAGGALAAFAFLGVWGGIERQSHLLGYAIAERREVASLIVAVPAFAPPARLLLIQPPGAPSAIAANNPNLVPFAYGDVALGNYRVTAPHSAFEHSTVDADPSGKIRVAIAPSKEEFLVDPAACIIVFYSVSQRRFVRLDRVPAGLLRGSGSVAPAYHPERWLREGVRPPPRAIAEFLSGAEPGEHAPGPSRRYARALARTPSAVMLTVAPALADRVRADSLAPYAVEMDRGRPAVWLGAGPTQGYSSMLWTSAPVSAALRLEVAPGPGRAAPERHLIVRVSGAGSDGQATREFSTRTGLDVGIRLAAGGSVLEVWLEDAPDGAGEDADHLARLGPMRLEAD